MEKIENNLIDELSKNSAVSKIFSDENIQTLKDNPNQWYMIASSVNDDKFTNVSKSYYATASYFATKLYKQHRMDIKFKTAQSKKDKSAKLFVMLKEEE